MQKIENYFEVFLVVTLILFFLYLIKSFLISLLFASTLVFLTYKYYQKILYKTKSENFSAIVVLFIVFTIIILPLYLISVELFNQTSFLMSSGNDAFNNVEINFCSLELCRNLEENMKNLNWNLNSIFLKFGNYVVNSAGIFFNSISKIVINLFIFILAFFFLLKDGDKFGRYIKRIIPMKNEYKTAIFLKFRDVSSAVFTNTLLIAFIQGALVSLGFFIFGIPSWLFWGVISTFFALIPVLGAAVVWIPAAIYLFFIKGYFFGIALVIYGIIVVGLSDNLLRPLMLKKKMEVHPFLILLSIMGGLEIFGFAGVFLGPILISFLISVIELYSLDFK